MAERPIDGLVEDLDVRQLGRELGTAGQRFDLSREKLQAGLKLLPIPLRKHEPRRRNPSKRCRISRERSRCQEDNERGEKTSHVADAVLRQRTRRAGFPHPSRRLRGASARDDFLRENRGGTLTSPASRPKDGEPSGRSARSRRPAMGRTNSASSRAAASRRASGSS
jgi:hypothetical protein